RSCLKQLCRSPARERVVALPDRAEAEDRDLPCVPIRQSVEAKDLVEDGVAAGVPALVGITVAVASRGEQRRKRPLTRQQLDEVLVPRVAHAFGHQPRLALAL